MQSTYKSTAALVIAPRRLRRRQLHRRERLFWCAMLAATAGVKPAIGGYSLTTVFSFSGPNGMSPEHGVTIDSSGNLFGVTYSGGVAGDGTVYELAAGSSVPATLVAFNNSSGVNPYAAPFIDSSGNLFGTTRYGGVSSSGTVFEIAAGSHAFGQLRAFGTGNSAQPVGGFVADKAGNLYGATLGSSGGGSIYQLTTVRLRIERF